MLRNSVLPKFKILLFTCYININLLQVVLNGVLKYVLLHSNSVNNNFFVIDHLSKDLVGNNFWWVLVIYFVVLTQKDFPTSSFAFLKHFISYFYNSFISNYRSNFFISDYRLLYSGFINSKVVHDGCLLIYKVRSFLSGYSLIGWHGVHYLVKYAQNCININHLL